MSMNFTAPKGDDRREIKNLNTHIKTAHSSLRLNINIG